MMSSLLGYILKPYVTVVGAPIFSFIISNTKPVDCGSAARPAAGCVTLSVTRW